MGLHNKQRPTDGIHTPISYVYADATARNAATGFVNPDDLYKLAYQVDTGDIYILDAIGPENWTQINGGAGGAGDVVGPASATDNAIARFDLTTGKLIQNSGVTVGDAGEMAGVGLIDLGTGALAGHTEGRIDYDPVEHTLVVYNDDTAVTHQLGQETLLRVYNGTGVTIPDGSAVYQSGVQIEAGVGRPEVSLAQANSVATANVLGVVTADIANGSYGYVTSIGFVNDINLTAYSFGDRLFLSETVAGGFQTAFPAAGNVPAQVGYVAQATASGRLLVMPSVALLTDHGQLAGRGDDDHTQYLLVSGSRAMTGALDMGGFAVSNVGNVDGVDVSAHASRHERGGVDEIDGDHLDVDFAPSSYTPGITPAEAANVDDLAAHLYGIDVAIGQAAAANLWVSQGDLDRTYASWSTVTGTPTITTGVADPFGGTDAVSVEDNDAAGFEAVKDAGVVFCPSKRVVEAIVYVKKDGAGTGTVSRFSFGSSSGRAICHIDTETGATAVQTTGGANPPINNSISAVEEITGWWTFKYLGTLTAAIDFRIEDHYPAIAATAGGANDSSQVGTCTFYPHTVRIGASAATQLEMLTGFTTGNRYDADANGLPGVATGFFVAGLVEVLRIDTGGGQSIFSNINFGTDGWQINVEANGSFQATIIDTAGGAVGVNSGTVDAINDPAGAYIPSKHFLVLMQVTQNGANNDVTLWVNGQLVSTLAGTNPYAPVTDIAQIGAGAFGNVAADTGISAVAYLEGTLTNTQILEWFHACYDNLDIVDDGLGWTIYSVKRGSPGTAWAESDGTGPDFSRVGSLTDQTRTTVLWG